MEKISVIVPGYQADKYIGRCIDSILAQTYRNLEIILVNDGSADGTGRIMEEYAGRDDRIRVINQSNQGLSMARNAGIDIMTGEWLTFVDADDYLPTTAMENLYNAITDTGCRIAVGDFARTKADTLEDFQSYADGAKAGALKTEILSAEEAVRDTLIPEHIKFITSWGILYHKDLFREIRFPQGRLHEDTYVNYLLYEEAGRIAVTDALVYGYYMSENSIMRSPFSTAKLEIIDAYKERYLFYCGKGNPQLERLLLEDYYFRLLRARGFCRRYAPKDAAMDRILQEIRVIYQEACRTCAFSGAKARIKAYIGRYFEGFYSWKWGNLEVFYI